MSPNVDVIVTAYRRPEALRTALQSIQRQTWTTWHCWIAEDGESDAVRDVIAPFLVDRRFHYLPGSHRGTPAAPRNRAIRAGQAMWIALCDDDDCWLPEKLEQQITWLAVNPDCILLGANAYRAPDPAIRDAPQELYLPNDVLEEQSLRDLLQDNRLISSSVVFAREVLPQTGLFNEQLFPVCGEDYDLWLRMSTQGKIWVLPEALLVYSDQPGQSIRSRSQTYHAYTLVARAIAAAMAGDGAIPSPLKDSQHRAARRMCRYYERYYRLRGACHRLGQKLRTSDRKDSRIHSPVTAESLSPRRRWLQRVNRLLRRSGLVLAPAADVDRQCEERDMGQQMYRDLLSASRQPARSVPEIVCIIFSRDRALQLHALLSSFTEKVRSPVRRIVLFHATSEEHRHAYREVEAMFRDDDVHFVPQLQAYSFYDDFLRLLDETNAGRVFFLVDDIVFTEPVDLSVFADVELAHYVPTLRMGKNLRYCYTQQCPQPLPRFESGALPVTGDLCCWRWDGQPLDWGYPLSVDGHIFDMREMRTMARRLVFRAPNTFEEALQQFRFLFVPRYGLCYTKSRLVNIPCNKVQDENQNRAGTIDPAFLLARWRDGEQMDYRRLYGFVNESAHQEIVLTFCPRATYARIESV